MPLFWCLKQYWLNYWQTLISKETSGFMSYTPVFGILNTKSCIMKLGIENASIWHLNASIWAFKRRRLVFMKSTPAY